MEREKYRRLTTANPGFTGAAWFVPDDRPWSEAPDPVMVTDNKEPPREAQIRIHAWLKSSSPWMYRLSLIHILGSLYAGRLDLRQR